MFCAKTGVVIESFVGRCAELGSSYTISPSAAVVASPPTIAPESLSPWSFVDTVNLVLCQRVYSVGMRVELSSVRSLIWMAEEFVRYTHRSNNCDFWCRITAFSILLERKVIEMWRVPSIVITRSSTIFRIASFVRWFFRRKSSSGLIPVIRFSSDGGLVVFANFAYCRCCEFWYQFVPCFWTFVVLAGFLPGMELVLYSSVAFSSLKRRGSWPLTGCISLLCHGFGCIYSGYCSVLVILFCLTVHPVTWAFREKWLAWLLTSAWVLFQKIKKWASWRYTRPKQTDLVTKMYLNAIEDWLSHWWSSLIAASACDIMISSAYVDKR